MISFLQSIALSILPKPIAKILQKIKLEIRIILYYPHFKKGIKCNHAWYGGKEGCGGFYVCPDKLNQDSIVYSFGVGLDISFDKEIYQAHNCHVFCFDPTPKSIQFMKEQKLPDKIHFYDFGIDNVNGQVDFYLPVIDSHVSGSVLTGLDHLDDKEKITVNMKSLEQIMKELGHSHIDLLKMDIEGYEYKVIENILNTNISIGQIVVEFHDKFFQNEKNKSKQTINHLKEKGFKIFAVSPILEEISFINKNAL